MGLAMLIMFYLVVYINSHHRLKKSHKDHATKNCTLCPFSAPKFYKTYFAHTEDPMHPGVFKCVEFENEFSFY